MNDSTLEPLIGCVILGWGVWIPVGGVSCCGDLGSMEKGMVRVDFPVNDDWKGGGKYARHANFSP